MIYKTPRLRVRKFIKSVIKANGLLLSVLLLPFIINTGPLHAKSPELAVAKSVDLQRYLGKWYEIARIDHSFQQGCKNSMAEYSLRTDGDIKVTNSCEIAGRKDRKTATGRAWVTDRNTNSKLRVQFFLSGIKLGFLSGKYWILELGENYDYVMIGEPSREYFWILSRTPNLDTERKDALTTKAKLLGFNTSKFLFNDLLE